MLTNALHVWAAGNILATGNTSYFQPNSTGIKLQNGFERIYIQVRPASMPPSVASDRTRSRLAITVSVFEQV